ncbi:LamG domain-containing protein [Desulfonatronum lacustre]|uniref:LamG domain-containing protein n=1 Tax=Desulfonatronum lacustre TaxID=66849 RepID=UPI00048C6529|nr:LamG domain-containing protein [Desulfonatronum lacustre]
MTKYIYSAMPSTIVGLLILILVVSFGCTREDQSANANSTSDARIDRIEDLTGAHTRVVWVQDLGQGGNPGAQGDNLRLMGFDSRDGHGQRVILDGPANFAKPYITPRGDRVVYTDRTRDVVMIVNWDGSGLREVTSGTGLAVWMDPFTGHEWLYVGVGQDGNRAPTRQRMERVRLDDPEVRELVWDQTPVTEDQVQLSIDGKMAGGTFPWPHAGVARLTEGAWDRLAQGCWPSISPDDQYLFWVFDGSHRNLTMQRYGTEHRWQVPINTAPGIDGYEVYHPRWSNHPRFLVVTGPYISGSGGNRIRTGGPEVSLHIGRFSEDFSTVEAWHRVTDDTLTDYYPDVWVASGLEMIQTWAAGAESTDAPTDASTDASARTNISEHSAAASSSAPDNGLVFWWENAARSSVLFDSKSSRYRDVHLEPRGTARLTRYFAMDTSRGGHFILEQTDDILSALRNTNQLTIEAVITPSLPDQSGPARIITFSSGPSARNVTLGQSGDRLVLRLRTERTGPNAVPPELDLLPLTAGEPTHVVVTYADGLVTAYADGQHVFSSDAVHGGFGTWSPQHLLFGDEWGGGRFWAGQLEGVAIYNQVLTPEKAAQRYSEAQARVADRVPAEVLVARVRLLEALPVPTVEAVAPYQRALLVNRYAVEEVLEGEAHGQEILIAHWVIMDGRVLETAPRRQGDVFQLRLEFFDDRPELEGEKISLEGHDFLLPLYYDVQS